MTQTQEQIEKRALFLMESRRQNITQIRGFIYQLIIGSGAIIGFTLPILDSSSLIKNSCFLIIGLFLLWIEIVLGFWYLKIRLENENNKLYNQSEKMKGNDVKDNSKNCHILSFLDKHILSILYGIFIIAMLLIIISMINFW